MSTHEPQWYSRLSGQPHHHEPMPTDGQIRRIQEETGRPVRNRRFGKAAVAVFAAVILCIGIIWFVQEQGNPPPQGTNTGKKEFGQSLSELHQEESYVFDGMPWLASKEEVLAQKQMDRNWSEDGDMLTREGDLFLDPSIRQYVIYIFQDNRLVSGEYRFVIEDKSLFTKLSKEMLATLSKEFPIPLGNSLNTLDLEQDHSLQEKNVLWEGKDRSTLNINIIPPGSGSNYYDYILQIKSSSPLPERKSLQP